MYDAMYVIMYDIMYDLMLWLMGLVIQRVKPNHFSNKLLKYIFMKLDFINIWWIT